MNKKPFEYTTIKFSSAIEYNTKNIIHLIGKKLNTSMDFKAYNTYYNGEFEFGTELQFFETLDKGSLLNVYEILKENVRSFGCYWIENKNLSGCSNELLFNNGCEVGLYIKNKDYKDE